MLKYIGHVICLIHSLSYGLIISSPLILYMIDLDRHNNNNYLSRNNITLQIPNIYRNKYLLWILIHPTVLLSWYLKSNVCILSEYEHYFNPDKYEIITVSSITIFEIMFSMLFSHLEIRAPTMYSKTIVASTYYVYIITSGIINYIYKA